jgi:hypothetical protein
MALLNVTEIRQVEIDPDGVAVAAAAGGDSYPNDDDTLFYLRNASGGSITATLALQRASVRKEGFGELTVTALVLVVPAAGRRLVKAPVGSHSDASGRVQVTYTAVTSVTVAALRAARQ